MQMTFEFLKSFPHIARQTDVMLAECASTLPGGWSKVTELSVQLALNDLPVKMQHEKQVSSDSNAFNEIKSMYSLKTDRCSFTLVHARVWGPPAENRCTHTSVRIRWSKNSIIENKWFESAVNSGCVDRFLMRQSFEFYDEI